MRRHAVLVASLLVAGAVLAVPAPRGVRAEGPALRVLFVGNSFTRLHDLPRLVRKMLERDGEARAVRVTRETRTGATLHRHWIFRRARFRIQSGGFTHVVLQDHSLRPIARPEEMAEAVRRFDELVDRTGAKTILYSTWARVRNTREVPRELASEEAMHARIEEVYETLAHEVDAEVAPVGSAFRKARAAAPEVQIYGRDGIHPSMEGSYLAACVFYGVLTGRSPENHPYRPWPMREDVAHALQVAASEALAERGGR